MLPKVFSPLSPLSLISPLSLSHIFLSLIVSDKDAARVKLFFSMADWDHSGTLSFNEYVTFFTLLSRPAAEFKIAFKLFDLNDDGFIEKRIYYTERERERERQREREESE